MKIWNDSWDILLSEKNCAKDNLQCATFCR